jgi:hypothetical protein
MENSHFFDLRFLNLLCSPSIPSLSALSAISALKLSKLALLSLFFLLSMLFSHSRCCSPPALAVAADRHDIKSIIISGGEDESVLR